MPEVEAGWYPDPIDPGRARLWTGTQWTEHTKAMAELLASLPTSSEVSHEPAALSDSANPPPPEVWQPEPVRGAVAVVEEPASAAADEAAPASALSTNGVVPPTEALDRYVDSIGPVDSEGALVVQQGDACHESETSIPAFSPDSSWWKPEVSPRSTAMAPRADAETLTGVQEPARTAPSGSTGAPAEPTIGSLGPWFVSSMDTGLELPDDLWEQMTVPGADTAASAPEPRGEMTQVFRGVRTTSNPSCESPTDGVWFTIFGGLLMALGSYAPWIMASTPGATLTRNAFQLGAGEKVTFDGPLCVLLGVVTVGIGILRLTQRNLPAVVQRAGLFTGVVVGLVVADRWSGTRTLIRQLDAHSGALAIVSYGYWVCAGGAVLSVLGALVGHRTRRAVASAQDHERVIRLK